MKNSTDIVIHVDEEMDSQRRDKFSNTVQELHGVLSASIQDSRPHLMMVAYNPEKTKALEVVTGIRNTGLHAQLISWL